MKNPFFSIEAFLKRILKPLVFRDEIAPRSVRFGVGRGLVLLLNRRHELQKELSLAIEHSAVSAIATRGVVQS